MKLPTSARITIQDRTVDYRVVRSKGAKKIRVRVGPGGIEVIHPAARDIDEVGPFLAENSGWISQQLERVERLRDIRKLICQTTSEILFRGTPTPVRVVHCAGRRAPNRVLHEAGRLTILSGGSATPPSRSLENWLRHRARIELEKQVPELTSRLRVQPNRVYLMGQRTKWGNCSAKGNLSFNWRVIMAPEDVLDYLVTHEVVHLAVPDHSQRFWLTVNSLCPSAERARRWLSANAHRLMIDLSEVVRPANPA